MQQQKKKVGRPAKIKDSIDVGIRLDREVVQAIDEIAAERRTTRSEVIRGILTNASTQGTALDSPDRGKVVMRLSYDVAVALGVKGAVVGEDGVVCKTPSASGQSVIVDQLVGRVYVSVDGKDAYEDALYDVDGVLDMEAVSRLKAEISKYAEAK